jgi:PAS domain S-box-containing protein
MLVTTERERFLEALLESAVDYAIIGLDLDGLVTSWNEGASAILGWSEAEMRGRPATTFFTLEDRQAGIPQAEMKAALETGHGSDERWHLRKDGKHFWASGEMMKLKDEQGAAQGFVKILRDRTEQRQVQERQRQDAEFLRSVLAASGDCIKVLDLEGKLVFINDNGIKLLDIDDLNQVQGKHWPETWTGEAKRHAETALETARAGGFGHFQGEARTLKGTSKYWDVQATAMLDAQGSPARLLVVSRDMTRVRQAELALQELAASLEQQVEARTLALQKTEEALRQSQKMEALGQLTGGIAHDFNNLLTGIIGSLDILRRRMAAHRLDDLDRFMDAAAMSAHRAASLVHRLLAFARRQSLDTKPADVNALIEGMEELLRRTLGETVTLKTDLGAEVWRAMADDNQLENAILNLAINARDAMEGGGRLTIETANTSFDAHYAARHEDVEAGDYVVICVSDTGSGMSPDVLAKAFDPFFTTKPIGEGTGLGLSMIYGFVKQSGGHVRIQSDPGAGTTVKLLLRRAEMRGAEQAPVAQELPLGRGETVLVVEDDPTVRLLMVDVLDELGYKHIEVPDGQAAVPVLQSRQRIDLLLTDVGLPNLNGRQVAEIGRQSRPDLKVLFVTGYAEKAAVRQGFLEPGMEMLMKPFALEALATKIRAMIESKEVS